MKNKIGLAIVGISITALTGLIVLLTTSTGQTVIDPGQKGHEDKINQEFVDTKRATFPVVDYVETDVPDTARRLKGRKYGLIPILNPSITGNSKEAIINEWGQNLIALPIKESQVVVLGKIVGTRAYLSDNRQAVYSEFKIGVEKIFKNETKTNVGVTDVIAAERQGGIVRFPSGFEQWVFIVGQGMPVLNKRYVFFLSYEAVGLVSQKFDLTILTGYEISDGHIFPLDSPGDGSHPIETYYKGKSEGVLLEDLEKSLKSRLHDLPKKEDKQ
ncbi:MAG: hypothetical protein ABL999_11290 [Pyrinomonadaceae bacterium]